MIDLSDSLTLEAQDIVKRLTARGFYWYWAMTQEDSYAGIRANPLTNTVACGRAGPNQLSEAIVDAHKQFAGMKGK